MIKTLDEYRRLGCPEDYLKNGDQVDMPLARLLTGIENIEDKVGLFTASHVSGACGDKPTMRAVARYHYGEPFIYIGEITTDEPCNRDPKHARKIFVSSPYRANTKEKLNNNIKIAKKVCSMIIHNGDFPIAPHLYFPSFLDDNYEDDRDIGIEYGLYLLDKCDEMLVITPEMGEDKTPYERLTEGMMTEVDHAVERGMKPKYISAGELWKVSIDCR